MREREGKPCIAGGGEVGAHGSSAEAGRNRGEDGGRSTDGDLHGRRLHDPVQHVHRECQHVRFGRLNLPLQMTNERHVLPKEEGGLNDLSL